MATKAKTKAAEPKEQAITRPKELAEKLDVSAKALRSWLRSNFPREAGEKNTSWTLTPEMVTAATEHYTKSDKDEESEDES